MALSFRLNRIQWLTLILLASIVLLRGIRAVTGNDYTVPGAILFLAFVASLLLAVVPPLVRRFTWRVRNRLLLTYFLVGVIPIVLIFLFVQFGFFLFLGQITNYLVQAALDSRTEQIERSAENIAEAVVDGKPLPSSDVTAVIRTAERESSGSFPEWSMPGFKGIVRKADGTFLLAAHALASNGGRRAEVFATRAVDSVLLSELLPGVASIQIISGSTVRFRINAGEDNSNFTIVADSELVAPPPMARNFVDNSIETASPLHVRLLEDGKAEEFAIVANTVSSAIMRTLFSSLGPTAFVLQLFMTIVAAIFLVVEIGAIVASIQLSRTLTGTVRDLYAGTKRVETGDFSHRIPVRAKDQLSELASSFNGMTARVEQLILDVKEKEKLESELEIARQVQSQLFPKEVPKLATLELAGVCNPARVVSGDYYDFIPIGSGGAAVVLGDISGKGISAALLMASVQASLHAQLAMSSHSEVSTAMIVTRLNRQLYENTPPEKYATFYCAVYDDQNSRLTYTNAGHLAPILIRDGKAIRLESNGTVVGMFPEYPFEQVDIDLQPGDLLAAFTDGITESENAQEEQFGEERLIELLTLHSGKPLDDVIRLVMEAVGAWAHDPSARDDITMLLARKLS